MVTKKTASTGADVPVAAPMAVPDTARYLVGATPILRDAKRFEPGSVIELPPAQALRLGLWPQAPSPVQTPKPLVE